MAGGRGRRPPPAPRALHCWPKGIPASVQGDDPGGRPEERRRRPLPGPPRAGGTAKAVRAGGQVARSGGPRHGRRARRAVPPGLLGGPATGPQEIISAPQQCRMHCKRARLPWPPSLPPRPRRARCFLRPPRRARFPQRMPTCGSTAPAGAGTILPGLSGTTGRTASSAVVKSTEDRPVIPTLTVTAGGKGGWSASRTVTLPTIQAGGEMPFRIAVPGAAAAADAAGGPPRASARIDGFTAGLHSEAPAGAAVVYDRTLRVHGDGTVTGRIANAGSKEIAGVLVVAVAHGRSHEVLDVVASRGPVGPIPPGGHAEFEMAPDPSVGPRVWYYSCFGLGDPGVITLSPMRNGEPFPLRYATGVLLSHPSFDESRGDALDEDQPGLAAADVHQPRVSAPLRRRRVHGPARGRAGRRAAEPRRAGQLARRAQHRGAVCGNAYDIGVRAEHDLCRPQDRGARLDPRRCRAVVTRPDRRLPVPGRHCLPGRGGRARRRGRRGRQGRGRPRRCLPG